MHKQKVLAMLFAGACTVLFLNGCYSDDDADREKGIADIRNDINRMKDPKSAISKIREYAAEKLNDATDQELELINNTEPVIKHNYDGTEFSFLWKNKEGQNIEVLTTPPPCEPVAVYRVRRIYYP
ncbi:MAG: hypothetical protein GY750_02560 [Lentisphaerae bacterium]|nr:hypothetical protein [Lentisphaerota bacterium]MCP4100304.1 hypothetical protein [Lentisphaerota bacterium]